MRPELRWSILGAIVLSIIVFSAAVMMVQKDPEEASAPASESSTSTSASQAQPAQKGSRPPCPRLTIPDVHLDCLGANTAPADSPKPVVLNLWAWWCAPCREELPIIDQYRRDHPEYEVIGAHVDPTGQAGADMLNELRIELPSYEDPNNVLAGYFGLPNVVPITLVFQDGKLMGMFPQTFHSGDALDAAVKSVLR